MKRRARRDEPFEVKRRDSSREWIEERFAALPDFDVRRLFSGLGLYSADVIFGIHSGAGGLYFKVDASTADDFTSRGSEPFCPRPGKRLGRYYEVPPEVVDDDDELLAWARRAIAVAQSSSAQPASAPSSARSSERAPGARRKKKAGAAQKPRAAKKKRAPSRTRGR